MDDLRVSKVEILIRQKKYTDAEKILKDLLSEDPLDIDFLTLFAEVNLQLKKFDIALKIIDDAIGLYPDEDILFYSKARILASQNKFDDAEKNLKQAIEIDPFNDASFAFWANIKATRKQFSEALNLADKSLEINPENILALNVRSIALLKLKKTEDSFETIEGALREDPNHVFTHSNYGWGLLEKGDFKKAKVHFSEALKNDPNFEYAQSGMLEAIKASNPVYRLFLQYSFFMGNLTAKYQWAVIVVFFVGMRILRTLANSVEGLKPILTPLIIALAFLAFSTWIINPISNLFLRFNKFGKYLLSKKEKMSSSFVACSLLVFFTGIVTYFLFKDEKYLMLAAFGFAMMLPLSVMFSKTKYKHSLLIYTIMMTLIGSMAVGLTFSNEKTFNYLTVIFIFGFIAFQWVANYLLIKEDNH